jgi:hypothetical protein
MADSVPVIRQYRLRLRYVSHVTSTFRTDFEHFTGRKSLDTICTLRIPDRLTRVTPSSTTPLFGPAAYSTANTPISSPRASNFALPAGLTMTRSDSHQGSSTPNQGRPTPAPGGEDSFRLVKCCFSFTIRRDSYVSLIINHMIFR